MDMHEAGDVCFTNSSVANICGLLEQVRFLQKWDSRAVGHSHLAPEYRLRSHSSGVLAVHTLARAWPHKALYLLELASRDFHLH